MYCNQELDFCSGHDAILLLSSTACQKWLTEQLCILHYPLTLCLCILYVSLCTIAGAERVSVEGLIGKIGWHHDLTISGFCWGWTGSTNWSLKVASSLDTASIKHTTLTLINMSTRTHVHTCWRQLWHPLPPPPPLELEACSLLSHGNCLLNERSGRLDGYSFSWGWLVYFWHMSWILCNCCTEVVSKICCL